MMNKDHLTADECLTILNKKSGVLALSGVSSDFRDIDAGAAKGDENCRLALDKFAYEVKKYIGAYTTVLGGLDCLVFTAGVGENSAAMRASICEGLEYLGIKLDPEKNKVRGEEAVISAADSKVTVWVIPTNEELMQELNGNEKYVYLDTKLPSDAANPGGIQAGDLMLYGDNCIVLFYKSFHTSYTYTKIGHVEGFADAAASMGTGTITADFSASK